MKTDRTVMQCSGILSVILADIGLRFMPWILFPGIASWNSGGQLKIPIQFIFLKTKRRKKGLAFIADVDYNK